MATVRQRFDAVVDLLGQLQVEQLRHADRAREGVVPSPSIQRVLELGVPAVRAQWQGLLHAQRHPQAWSQSDFTALLEILRTDLLAVLAVLRGDLVLTDVRDN